MKLDREDIGIEQALLWQLEEASARLEAETHALAAPAPPEGTATATSSGHEFPPPPARTEFYVIGCD